MTQSGQQQIRFSTSRDGTRIAYAVCGKGPMLLWAPHWIRHLNRDWDSPMWRHWLMLLTRHYTVVRYDYRGCGLSDRQGVTFSLAKHVEDMEAVVDSAGLASFPLVAQAGGGLVALAYAAKHPHKVSRLALYGCQSRGRSVRGMPVEPARESEALLKLIEFGWRNEGPAYGQFFVTLHMPKAHFEQIRAGCELLRVATSPANALEILRVFFKSDVSDQVARIKSDTLVLHAREDPIIPFNEGRTLASLIPNAKLVPLESGNHVLEENEPAWDSLSAALSDFLSIPSETRERLAKEMLGELTARENQVLELIAQGHNNATIGLRLGISERTARNHVSTILSKLGVNTRAQAIVRARDAGYGQEASR
jgi:pimeloyl-ACP methyl ester carboxylesterase/DNA-binding CsgD family transcriptional regulator